MSLPKLVRMCLGQTHDTWFADDHARQKYGSLVRTNPLKLERKFPKLRRGNGGSFSATYMLEDGNILKASRCSDEAYQEFLRLAIKRQSNPFYPKVFAVGFYFKRQMVVMEKLTRLTKTHKDLGLSIALHSTLSCVNPSPFLYPLIGTKREMPPEEALRKLFFNRAVRHGYMAHKQAFRQLVEDLVPLAKKYNYDLHQDNVMVRPHAHSEGGQLVVIDPVC